MKNPLLLVVFALLAFTVAPEAFASATGGLPWEGPLQTIQNSITGPVALSISLIAIVIAGAMLIMGSEINEFARRMILVVLVLALLVAANNVLSTLYGTSGAVVG